LKMLKNVCLGNGHEREFQSAYHLPPMGSVGPICGRGTHSTVLTSCGSRYLSLRWLQMAQLLQKEKALAATRNSSFSTNVMMFEPRANNPVAHVVTKRPKIWSWNPGLSKYIISGRRMSAASDEKSGHFEVGRWQRISVVRSW
jgi:hypothetical protein